METQTQEPNLMTDILSEILIGMFTPDKKEKQNQ
jgi:hypothetical protein